MGLDDMLSRRAATTETVRVRSRPMAITSRDGAFLDGIFHVVFVGAKEQMANADAETIISAGAVVTDQESFGNGAVSEKPRDLMCLPSLSWKPERPVATRMDRARPNPALAGLIDFGPKPFHPCTVSGFRSARTVTYELMTTGRWNVKRPSTDQTRFGRAGAERAATIILNTHRSLSLRCHPPAVHSGAGASRCIEPIIAVRR
jgi:hypothetical protein